MKKIPKQEYTTEFKEQAVKNAQAMGIVVTAKELGLVEQTLRNWVSSADGKLTAPGAKPVTPEQMELSRLRAENARLKMHVDILRRVSPLVAGISRSPIGRAHPPGQCWQYPVER